MISLIKYSVLKSKEQSEEEFIEELTEDMCKLVEDNLDTSSTLVQLEGTNEIEVKILKLNEHTN